jgi:hypothetical protein
MEAKFKTDSAMWKIDQLIKDLDNNEINTNVVYQRDIVWDNVKQGFFINSCYRGIVPNPIILNKIYDDNDIQQTSCIDGKQRLNTISRFKNNEICFEFNGEKIYFSEVPSEFENEKNFRVLTNLEKQDNFLMVKMPVVEYKNLSYQDEVDIFNRIQHGTPLKSGELIPSLIGDPKVTERFNQFCKDKEQLFKLIKDVQRKDHINLITYIMYMVDTNKLCKITQKQKAEYFKNNINTTKALENVIMKSDKLIDTCFSKKITSNKTFRKLTDNQKLVFIFYVYKIYEENDYKLKTLEYNILNESINDFHAECKTNNKFSNKSTDKMFGKLYKLFTQCVDQYE